MGRWKIGQMGGWVNDRIQTDGEKWTEIYIYIYIYIHRKIGTYEYGLTDTDGCRQREMTV